MYTARKKKQQKQQKTFLDINNFKGILNYLRKKKNEIFREFF